MRYWKVGKDVVLQVPGEYIVLAFHKTLSARKWKYCCVGGWGVQRCIDGDEYTDGQQGDVISPFVFSQNTEIELINVQFRLKFCAVTKLGAGSSEKGTDCKNEELAGGWRNWQEAGRTDRRLEELAGGWRS
jgi:hypothetical protein